MIRRQRQISILRCYNTPVTRQSSLAMFLRCLYRSRYCCSAQRFSVSSARAGAPGFRKSLDPKFKAASAAFFFTATGRAGNGAAILVTPACAAMTPSHMKDCDDSEVNAGCKVVSRDGKLTIQVAPDPPQKISIIIKREPKIRSSCLFGGLYFSDYVKLSIENCRPYL